jgi:hypothetical protein
VESESSSLRTRCPDEAFRLLASVLARCLRARLEEVRETRRVGNWKEGGPDGRKRHDTDKDKQASRANAREKVVCCC